MADTTQNPGGGLGAPGQVPVPGQEAPGGQPGQPGQPPPAAAGAGGGARPEMRPLGPGGALAGQGPGGGGLGQGGDGVSAAGVGGLGGAPRPLPPIDSRSSQNPGDSRGGDPLALAKGARERDAETAIKQSQKTLGLFLTRAIAQEDEELRRILGKHRDLVIRRLRDGIHSYTLLKGASNLRLDEADPAGFVWSEHMMDKTRLSGVGGPGAALQQLRDPSHWLRAPASREPAPNEVSAIMRAHLLQPLCESTSLEPTTALRLLESYFCAHPEVYHFIHSLEQTTVRYEVQLSRHLEQATLHAQQAALAGQGVNPWAPPGFGAMAHPQDPQRPQVDHVAAQLRHHLEQAGAAHRKQVEETKLQVQKFYLSERACLLENLVIIFAQSAALSRSKHQPGGGRQGGQPGLEKLLGGIRRELIKEGGGDIIRKLIEGLKRNLEWETNEFRQLDEQQRRIVMGSLQREQIVMLELLFALALDQSLEEQSTIEFHLHHLAQFMDYLRRTGYKGYLTNVLGEHYPRDRQRNYIYTSDIQMIQESKIKDLGILTFLAMLRIDIYAGSEPTADSQNGPKQNLIRKLHQELTGQGRGVQGADHPRELIRTCVKSSQMPRNPSSDRDATPSIICLALIQVLEQVDQWPEFRGSLGGLEATREVLGMKDIFGQTRFIPEVDSILRCSYLLTVPGHESQGRLDDNSSASINGEFLKILKSFINLIYEPVLSGPEMAEQRQQVKRMTIEIFLKNPMILRDVWRQIEQKRASNNAQARTFNTLSMFEGILEAGLSGNITKPKSYQRQYNQLDEGNGDPSESPATAFPFFTFLMKVLCGKNRLPHAHRVFDMINEPKVRARSGPDAGRRSIINQQNENIISSRAVEEDQPSSSKCLTPELLARYLILLNRLLEGHLDDQEDFDTLANLAVIFSKIIKQSPGRYSEINHHLSELIDRTLRGFAEDENMQEDGAYSTEAAVDDPELHNAITKLIWVIPLGDPEAMDGPQACDPQIAAHPFLVLLVRSLFLFSELDMPELTNEIVKQCMDAISRLFASYNELKKSIFDLILQRQELDKFLLTSYFWKNCMVYEQDHNDFKCTLSYLKFMCKVFKIEYPQMLLSRHKQVNLHQSILEEMLQGMYSRVMANFSGFKFSSIGHFAKFGARIMKLTKILLQKFDDGNLTPAKIEIMQHNPKFDMLLNIIFGHLKPLQLKTIIDTLQLEEIGGFTQSYKNIRQQFIQNKFLAQLIRQSSKPAHEPGDLALSSTPTFGAGSGPGSSSSGGATIPRDKILVNDMMSQSLKCLNQILRMCYQNELFNDYKRKHNRNGQQQNFKESRGLKLYYIQQLGCVMELRDQLCEPSAQQELSLKCNLVNLMAFYSKAEYVTDGQPRAQSSGHRDDSLSGRTFLQCHIPYTATFIKIQNNILAQEFLKITCQLWQIQSLKSRIDFKLLLVKNGFLSIDDIKKLFLAPVIAALRELKVPQRPDNAKSLMALSRYLIQTFEMLIICAQSQHSFIEHLFSQDRAVEEKLIEDFDRFFAVSDGATIEDPYKDVDVKQLVRQVGQKIVSLFSVMMAERVGYAFLKNLFGLGGQMTRGTALNVLKNILDTLIAPICVREAVRASQLNLNMQNKFFSGEDHVEDFFSQEATKTSVDADNRAITHAVHNHCSSLFTIAEFLKLVQNLFINDPIQNVQLRRLIQELYSDDRFGLFFEIQSTGSLKRELKARCEGLKAADSEFARFQNHQGSGGSRAGGRGAWEQDSFRKLRDFAQARLLVTTASAERLLNEDQKACNAFNHCLVSHNYDPEHHEESLGSVHLSPLDSYGVYKGLKYLQQRVLHASFPATLTFTSSAFEIYQTHGNVGSEFVISTMDLKYLLVNSGYQNLKAVNEFQNSAQIFNLCLSALVAQNTLDEEKSAFIMSIGKTKLRENLKTLPSVSGGQGGTGTSGSPISGSGNNKSFQMLASVFPLVDKDFPSPSGVASNRLTREAQNSVDLLIKRNLAISRGVFKLLQQELQHHQDQDCSSQSLYLNFKHSETLFEYLETSLSTLNVCVSQSSLQNICKLDVFSATKDLQEWVCYQLLVNLTKVYNYHMNYLVSADLSSLAGGGLSNARHQQPQIHDTQSDAYFLKQGEMNYSSLYLQIVLSSFQIVESISEAMPRLDPLVAQAHPNGSIIQKPAPWDECLSKVVHIMHTSIQNPHRVSESHHGASNAEFSSSDGQGSSLLFRDCLRALQVAIELSRPSAKASPYQRSLASSASMQEFMQRRQNPPLRIIVQKFVDGKSNDIEESIMIVQFLNTYADNKRGAQHLYSENIFQHLQTNRDIRYAIQSAEDNCYVQSPAGESSLNGEPMSFRDKRNPYHILWCQVLLLIRTLNNHLLEEDSNIGVLDGNRGHNLDPQAYLRSLMSFLLSQGIEQRISTFFCSKLSGAPERTVSHGFLEELELLMSIVCQLLMRADLMGKTGHGYGLLQGLKDCLIFGATKYFTRQPLPLESTIRARSATEKYLRNRTAASILSRGRNMIESQPSFHLAGKGQEFSLLHLKTQIHLIKIYVTFCSSLINLVLQDKETVGGADLGLAGDLYSKRQETALFPLNWQYIFQRFGNQSHPEFNQSYSFAEYGPQLKGMAESDGYGALIKLAFESIISAQESMRELYQRWNASLEDTKRLFDALHQIVSNDDQITQEYFALNSIFVASDPDSAKSTCFEEFLCLLETSLQMGNQLSALILEKVKESHNAVNTTASQGYQISSPQTSVIECARRLLEFLESLEQDVKLFTPTDRNAQPIYGAALGQQENGGRQRIDSHGSSVSLCEASRLHKLALLQHIRELKEFTREVQANARKGRAVL